MNVQTSPPALRHFVDDELLRAPLLFDQVVEGSIDAARKALPQMSAIERAIAGELMQALTGRRGRLSEYFVNALREQVQAELARREPRPAHEPRPMVPATLSLVDEDEVAIDVELSHTIRAVRDGAEYELRELQTFVSALVGDMDVARDHNPLRPEAFARALWAAAHALPLSKGHQLAFMRHAGPAMAQVLRRTYAAATARLEQMGVEPAAYRTLILPSGSRRGGRSLDTTFTPDLYGMRERMPVPTATAPVPLSYEGQSPDARLQQARLKEIARAAITPIDRQSVELVSRLFQAIGRDERMPADVRALIGRLQGPALRLVLRDPQMLEDENHPLWLFVNRLAYEAEMAPDPSDPERARLLRLAQATIEQLSLEPEQSPGLYRWAVERLDAYLQQRLGRRLTRGATQIGALQKLEDRLCAGQTTPSTMHGTLDLPQLDTVPAALMATPGPEPERAPITDAEQWLESLEPGGWLRMFIQGRWVQVQLLWPGERREVWLFGDGASDATWAVRRRALLTLHEARLLKPLRQRSVLRSAAAQVHQQVAREVGG